MKKMNLKLMALAVVALITFSACEKDDDSNGESGTETDQLIGELTENKTLESGSTYYLTGGYHVKPGFTLTIESGVTIIAKDDNISDYILIEQGAKINAEGTSSKPIVMTSERKERGAWGGIHICGKAPINVTGAKSEIGDAAYGGTDANDNSGVLKYIRLEYTGYTISEDKESNGFTFYGVGNGTKAEYLQSYYGKDDGFEWFGGTIDCKYLVSTNSGDDSFDWTQGWKGKGQFWVAYQAQKECDCLMECDNNSKDNLATPISHPTIANVTLVGNSEENKRGIRLRAGTEIELYNVLVTGKDQPLVIETDATQASLVDGSSNLEYIYLALDVTTGTEYTKEMFLDATKNNKVNASFTFTDNYIGTVEGGKDMSTVDKFFTKTNYKGAVSATDNWTVGWTK